MFFAWPSWLLLEGSPVHEAAITVGLERVRCTQPYSCKQKGYVYNLNRWPPCCKGENTLHQGPPLDYCAFLMLDSNREYRRYHSIPVEVIALYLIYTRETSKLIGERDSMKSSVRSKASTNFLIGVWVMRKLTPDQKEQKPPLTVQKLLWGPNMIDIAIARMRIFIFHISSIL